MIDEYIKHYLCSLKKMFCQVTAFNKENAVKWKLYTKTKICGY